MTRPQDTYPKGAPPDTTSAEGAARLVEIITRYWAEQGGQPRLRVMGGRFDPDLKQPRVDIRSNMINGWPREIAAYRTRLRKAGAR